MEIKVIHVKVNYKSFGFESINLLDEEQLKVVTDLSKEGWEIKAATAMNIGGSTRSICYTLQRQSGK